MISLETAKWYDPNLNLLFVCVVCFSVSLCHDLKMYNAIKLSVLFIAIKIHLNQKYTSILAVKPNLVLTSFIIGLTADISRYTCS